MTTGRSNRYWLEGKARPLRPRVKRELARRLDGGNGFVTTEGIATHFDVEYERADLTMRELETGGYLELFRVGPLGTTWRITDEVRGS